MIKKKIFGEEQSDVVTFCKELAAVNDRIAGSRQSRQRTSEEGTDDREHDLRRRRTTRITMNTSNVLVAFFFDCGASRPGRPGVVLQMICS